MDEATRAKLQAKFGSQAVRTGGRGTVRRKKKAVRKTATQDDKRLQSTLKKLNVNTIPTIEEVNLFKSDGKVIHFTNPKVQAAIAANTYVVSGNCEEKELSSLMPEIYSQLGPDSVENLKQIIEQYSKNGAVPGAAAGEDDEDVPDLVDNFESTANEEISA